MVTTKNKKGWLRIVEAALAILIIFGVLLTVVGTRQIILNGQDLSALIPPLLEEISKNVTLREKIISNDSSAIIDINFYLKERIKQPYLNYAVKICIPTEVCSLESYPTNARGDVFAAERIISSTLTQYNPKKIKIFLWRIG